MIDRRDLLKLTTCAGAGLLLGAPMRAALAAEMEGVMTRPVPSSGEQLPVVGLGSSATFGQTARSEDVSGLREVLQTLVEKGGKVFDTAPGYGASEEVAGELANELGITDKIFWATKVNVAGRGGGSADPDAARQQIENSFAKFKVDAIDLIQVHNLGDIPTQLGILKELKEQGRVRYIGVTSTFEPQYSQLMDVMRNEPIDFIGVDYAIDNRTVEAEILPLAMERKIGTLIYVPFGRSRLFSRVGDRALPEWAAEFDAATWAQFFIKFILANPAVTVITPATSKAEHMADNLGGGMGRLPTADHIQAMIELIDNLPA
jgi:aryl-alcohol dehydrogenase-like predicted oxidoreductase